MKIESESILTLLCIATNVNAKVTQPNISPCIIYILAEPGLKRFPKLFSLSQLAHVNGAYESLLLSFGTYSLPSLVLSLSVLIVSVSLYQSPLVYTVSKSPPVSLIIHSLCESLSVPKISKSLYKSPWYHSLLKSVLSLSVPVVFVSLSQYP